MIRKIALTGMLLTCLWSRTTRFEVSLWGVHVADVVMAHADTLIKGRSVVQIDLTATTSGLSNKLYPVDNHYVQQVDPESYRTLYFKKDTSQPQVTNHLETTLRAEEVCYTGEKACIPDSAFTIFSLLDYLARNQPETMSRIALEREGQYYSAGVTTMEEDESVIKYNLEITLNSHQPYGPVFEHTDIFSWAVLKPNAKRIICIDKKTRTISQCEFQFGMMALTAVAIKK